MCLNAGYGREKGYGLSTPSYVVIYLCVIIIMFPFEKKNKREFEKVNFSHLLYIRKQYGLFKSINYYINYRSDYIYTVEFNTMVMECV
jgi:hypothetical protein